MHAMEDMEIDDTEAIEATIGTIDAIRNIINTNGNPNLVTQCGKSASPLWRTSSYDKYLPLTMQLLEINADPSLIVNDDHTTPVAMAISFGAIATLKLLLVAGANCNQPNPNSNWTSLHLICDDPCTCKDFTIEERVEIARILLDHGAQRDAMNRQNQTPIQIARHKFPNSPLVAFLTQTDKIV